MRIAAILLMAVATAACASWDKSETVVTELGRIPAEEAIGLSRGEIEKRLGLAPIEQPRLLSAALEDGVLVERVLLFGMAQSQRCPGGRMPDISFTRAGKSRSIVSLIYRDGLLSAYGDERRGGDDVSQPAFLTASCTTFQRSGRDATEGAFQLALAAPVLLPFGAVIGGINAIGSIGAPDINAALVTLPLGAVPPGGLDAWLADLPAGARLVSREGNVTKVGFDHREPESKARLPAVTVTFADGVVSRLEGSRCTLTRARAFRCERS
jgi:hypothetical protein